MKIDNNQLLPVLVTCTGSRDKISKLNKELFNFHVITTKVSSNYINKIVFSGSCFQKKIVFLHIRVQLKFVQIEKQ